MKDTTGLRIHVVELEPSLFVAEALLRHGCITPPCQVTASSEREVVRRVTETLRLRRETEGWEAIEPFLWPDRFTRHRISIRIHPATSRAGKVVVGARKVPVSLVYLLGEMEGGGTRVLVPRFGWWFYVDEPGLAEPVLRQALGGALLEAREKGLFYLQDGISETLCEVSTERFLEKPKEDVERPPTPTLDNVADDLTADKGRDGERAIIGPRWGDDLVDDARRELFATRRSILIVGPTGVGKRTWIRRAAGLLAHCPCRRTGVRGRVFQTDAERIRAGMKYLGQWQERCIAMVDEAAEAQSYLALGDLAPLFAPASGGSLSDLLLPKEGSSHAVMVTATHEEYRNVAREHASSLQRLEVVRLGEPSFAESVEFADVLGRRLGAEGLAHPARKRLVELLTRFEPESAFPGKLVRFLRRLDRTAIDACTTRDGMTRAFARYRGLPYELLSDEAPLAVESIASRLERELKGQPEACMACARVIARWKAGLSDPNRPLGVLLFAGPTGVGKTELCKTMARYLYGDAARLIRIDMGEYGLRDSGRRLIDVAPGSQSLVARVRGAPLSIVLLDEIEKAHSSILDMFLALFDEGRLSDEDGRTVDFRSTLIVMTSNLGSDPGRTVGFGEPGRAGAERLRALTPHFRPELWNRIDEAIVFRHLSEDTILEIVGLLLADLAEREGLARRRLALEVAEETRRDLAREGFDPAWGARPLRRTIERRVAGTIALLLSENPALADRTLWLGPEGARCPSGAIRLVDPGSRQG